jgi:hypothetical protein
MNTPKEKISTSSSNPVIPRLKNPTAILSEMPFPPPHLFPHEQQQQQQQDHQIDIHNSFNTSLVSPSCVFEFSFLI